MTAPVVVIGAGMGGLGAAIRLARRGLRVQVIEARPRPGGLASGVEHGGFAFDGGPYILLDRPGLAWAFAQLGLDLDREVPLQRIQEVYTVAVPGAAPLAFHADLERTADGFERQWPGSGARYRRFVAQMRAIHARLQPLLLLPRPGIRHLLTTGAWRHARFLASGLQRVLRASGLPPPVCAAIAIWTHVAGQTVEQAPSPLAFVPALIHEPGAFYPLHGIGGIVAALERAALAAGVEMRCGRRVAAIRTGHGAVRAVELADGEVITTGAVLSNAHGVGTYASLLDCTPPRAMARLDRLPLQSPGICVYLAIRPRSDGPAPYLRFALPGGGELCRLLVTPGSLLPGLARDGWLPARLIAPMRHAEAQRLGPDGQHALAQRLIAEPWWREQAGQEIGEHRVLHVRVPAEWGADFTLHRDSMNPVMTAEFMRAGRLAHRSPHARGLHLAGSSTHPGQWLSFCAISGILAADQLAGDLRC